MVKEDVSAVCRFCLGRAGLGKLRRAKRTLYPFERKTGEKMLPKVMDVWRRAKKEKSYVQIGLDMGLKRKTKDTRPLSRPLRAKDLQPSRTRPLPAFNYPHLLEEGERSTVYCVRRIGCDSLSGTESQRSGANGWNNERLV